ncbi:MAG: hypothetical protein LBQ34_06460 [Alphaproteobacteria bacterium]|jgi:hypothetical protein|nr:hypothetical protein [Alphaproteobacteria bacterium]
MSNKTVKVVNSISYGKLEELINDTIKEFSKDYGLKDIKFSTCCDEGRIHYSAILMFEKI